MEDATYGAGLTSAGTDEERRLAAAEEVFDPATFRHLDALGIAQGMRCLEVGGGGGSVAAFMSERVSKSGSVLVTDLSLALLKGCDRPNIEARVHDIRTDPLDEAAFDIIHARLVLEHFPERLTVLDKMVSALRPGGWILVEDFDHTAELHLSPASRLFVPPQLGGALQRCYHATVELAGTQIDLEFGRDLPRYLAEAGLEEVDAETYSRLVRGGSSRANYWVLGGRLAAAAAIPAGLLSQADFNLVDEALQNPGSMMQSTTMVSAWGRRPARI
jgi:ubiquinone/menaquinone biosynthesis C-methylase UbiE